MAREVRGRWQEPRVDARLGLQPTFSPRAHPGHSSPHPSTGSCHGSGSKDSQKHCLGEGRRQERRCHKPNRPTSKNTGPKPDTHIWVTAESPRKPASWLRPSFRKDTRQKPGVRGCSSAWKVPQDQPWDNSHKPDPRWSERGPGADTLLSAHVSL